MSRQNWYYSLSAQRRDNDNLIKKTFFWCVAYMQVYVLGRYYTFPYPGQNPYQDPRPQDFIADDLFLYGPYV